MIANYQLRSDQGKASIGSHVAILLLACALVGIGSISSAAAQSSSQSLSRVADQLVGSWLVTYDVQAFGVPIPVLLSFGNDGVMIETDTPAPTPGGSLGTLILSNGHGAWALTTTGEFSYLYRKLVYQQDGLTPFGTTRTQATGTTNYGTELRVTLLIEFLDTSGNVVLSTTGTATGTRIQVEQP